MDIVTDKILHNGDGLCFLNEQGELVGIRADVVRESGKQGLQCVSTNRPHGAIRGSRIYRNYDLDWQKKVDNSTGNRKIDILLTLSESPEGYAFSGKLLLRSQETEVRSQNDTPEGLNLGSGKLLLRSQETEARSQNDTPEGLNLGRKPSDEKEKLSVFHFPFSVQKIPALQPEKALENIKKKALQWGDTPFNPVGLEIDFSQPYMIPASVIGEMKRSLSALMVDALVEEHRSHREQRDVSKVCELENAAENTISKDPGQTLMTCHHCIRFANGMCSKVTGQKATPLYLRNGANTFRLEFDCRQCIMKVLSV